MNTPVAKEPLILIGAGGFGYEMRAMVPANHMPFEFVGFLDNQKSGADILGKIDGHLPATDTKYASAIGDPWLRYALCDPLEKAGARFANLISVYANSNSSLPENSDITVLGNGNISNEVTVGAHTLLHGMSLIGHNVSIGRYCAIGPFVFAGGGVQIGAFVTIHPHVTILPNLTIGEGAILGAGSVVIKNVEAHTTVFGNPAKVIDRRTPPTMPA